jgi:hypothetical protein
MIHKHFARFLTEENLGANHLEALISQQVERACKLLGVDCRKLELSGSRYWPDLTLMKNGRIVFLELKRIKGSKEYDGQRRIRTGLVANGFNAVITKGLREALDVLQQFFGEQDEA